MRLPHFVFLCLAVAVLAPRTTAASAKYAWVPEDPNACCRGVLELSDEAFLAGGATWTPGFPLEGNPVERFHFEGRFKVSELQPASSAAERDVDLVVTFAATPETARCCAWDFQLRVAGDGLTGRLRVTTQNDDIVLSSVNGAWRIERAGSDAVTSGSVCGTGAPSPCTGDRGKWVLISSPNRLQKTGDHGGAIPFSTPSFHLR